MIILKNNKKFIELHESELIIHKLFYKKIFKLEKIESIFINKTFYLKIYYNNKWYSYNVGNLEDVMNENLFKIVGKLNENKKDFWLYTTVSSQNIILPICWCLWTVYLTIDNYHEQDDIRFLWIAFLIFWLVYMVNILFYRKDLNYNFDNRQLTVRSKSGRVNKYYTVEDNFSIKKSTIANIQYKFNFKDNKISPIDDIAYPKTYSNNLDDLFNLKNKIK